MRHAGGLKRGKRGDMEGREEWRDRSVPDSLWHPQQAGGKRGGQHWHDEQGGNGGERKHPHPPLKKELVIGYQ